MIYSVYLANAGVPETGLTLTWASFLKVSDGADPGDSPSFTEVGGGWYKFTYIPTEDINGVVDGSGTLNDNDRYIPISLSPQDALLDDNITHVDGRLTSDTTGLNVIRLAAEDDSDVSALATQTSVDGITARLLDDSTGLHAIYTLAKDLHMYKFNKVTLTRNSSTSYTLVMYADDGTTVQRTISITKDGSVETREGT